MNCLTSNLKSSLRILTLEWLPLNILLKLYFILHFTSSQVLLGICESMIFCSENHLQAQEYTFCTKTVYVLCQSQERHIFSSLLNCKHEYSHTESCKHNPHFIAIFVSHTMTLALAAKKTPRKPKPKKPDFGQFWSLLEFRKCISLSNYEPINPPEIN